MRRRRGFEFGFKTHGAAFSTSTDDDGIISRLSRDVKKILKVETFSAGDAESESSASAVADDGGYETDEDDYVDMINPETGEWNGPRGLEPTRHGDWHQKGRATDFS